MKADWCQGTETVPMSWSLIECAVGIISCCLPTLRSLTVLLFGRRRAAHGAVATVGSGGKRVRQIVSNDTHNDGTLPYEGTTVDSAECNQSDHGPGDGAQLTGISVPTEIE